MSLKVVHINKPRYTDEAVRELAAILIKKQNARQRAWIKKHYGVDIGDDPEDDKDLERLQHA